MKILHLTLKKKWFDMIASGEKPYEYREVKPYWTKRLFESKWDDDEKVWKISPKKYDIVRFRNGYTKNAPTIDVQLIFITVGFGFAEWGAEPGKEYFVLKLGDVVGM